MCAPTLPDSNPPASSARAVSRSVTTSCSDGAARCSSVPVISTGPITTEQADPGGVYVVTPHDNPAGRPDLDVAGGGQNEYRLDARPLKRAE